MKAGSLVTPEQTLLCNPCLRLKLAAAILVLSAVPALAAELPSDLAKAVKDYYQAQFHNDVPALKRLVSDDYVLVTRTPPWRTNKRSWPITACRDSRLIPM
jgi:hypothetical protein